MEKINIRLKNALTLRGMSAADLARASNVSAQNLSRYLSGAVRPKQIIIDRLAAALVVSPAWLMGYDVPVEREPELDTLQVTDAERRLIETFRRFSPADRERWLTMLNSLGGSNDA